MNTSAVLTEAFEPFRAGASGSSQANALRAAAAITAIDGAFAVAAPFGAIGDVSGLPAYLVTSFPLDDI